MQPFQYWLKTESCFGAGSESKTAALVRKHGGRRILVVYGGGSCVRSGLLGRICEQLQAENLTYETFGGVQPNPRLAHAELGVQKALAMDADLILAVGGGSVIDTAKAIAHGKANPGTPLWSFWSGAQPVTRSLPVGVVLTIPAAGSETSDSAVLTNEALQSKRGLSTDFNRPAFAVLDPCLAATLPPYQAACGVTDILMHTLDRYFNPVPGNETSDALAEALLRVVLANGKKVVADPADCHAMSEIMWCGSLSHNGLTGLGGAKGLSVHPVSFALSEKFDIIHAEALSALWCSWARYVCKVHPENEKLFARFARSVWDIAEPDIHKAANAGIDASEAYFKSLGMPVSIGALSCGVQDAAGVEDLAARVSYHGTRRVGTLVSLDHEALREIFKMANH